MLLWIALYAAVIHPKCINTIFFLLQLWRTTAARLFHSGWQRCRVPLHHSLSGSVFPAVLGVVVLSREPDHYEVSHLPPYTSTSASPGGPGHRTDGQQIVPTLPESAQQWHDPGHFRLRFLLPLHLYVREDKPQVSTNGLPVWITALN